MRDFWRVYRAGTHHRYLWRRGGRNVVNLTPHGLDTTPLENGQHAIAVAATDLCGNRATLTKRVRIDNLAVPAASGGGR